MFLDTIYGRYYNVGNCFYTKMKEDEKYMSTNLLEIIEAEYDAFCLDRTKDLNKMYELLYDYLFAFIASRIKWNNYVDYVLVEELTQESITDIATEIIYTFKKKAKFTTVCTRVAKNKIADYFRNGRRKREESLEKLKEEGLELSNKALFSNPEKALIVQEYKLEQIEILKKYLKLLMSQKGKPYRIAGCCYTMVLFHRYNPKTKELSSPKWAFAEVHDSTVEESADRFEREMNEWFPRFGLYWGDEFLDAIEEKEEGCLIADMVYEEHFQVKDFENWSLRMRKKIKDALILEELELLSTEGAGTV